MRALILAAGRGKRMNFLTEDKPKCLVMLKGRTLLDWQLKAIREAGIEKIAIVTGYKRELLQGYKINEFYNKRWATTNMISSLACAKSWIDEEPCVVSYSDIFFDRDAIIDLMASRASIAITYDPNWLRLWSKRFKNPLSDAETFSIDSKKRVTEIGQTPHSIKEIQGQFMGLMKLSSKGLKEIERVLASLPDSERDIIDTTTTLSKIVKQGKVPIVGVPYTRKWGEIDLESDLALYSNHKEFDSEVKF